MSSVACTMNSWTWELSVLSISLIHLNIIQVSDRCSSASNIIVSCACLSLILNICDSTSRTYWPDRSRHRLWWMKNFGKEHRCNGHRWSSGSVTNQRNMLLGIRWCGMSARFGKIYRRQSKKFHKNIRIKIIRNRE